MHQNDFLALLARVAGLGALAADATFQTSLTALLGPFAVKIIAGISLASILAADVIRIQSVPTGTTGPITVQVTAVKDTPHE